MMVADGGERTYGKHPGDLLRVVLGTSTVLGTSILAYRGEVSLLETDLFRLINHLPSGIGIPLQIVMEAGSLGAVVVASAAARAAGSKRLSRDLAVGGSAAWVAAKLVKLVVTRERPAVLLSEVLTRGTAATGLGFPSGHAAVAAALAAVASPLLGRRAGRVAWVLAWLVAAARLYVGAHLPLDAIAGLALGWAIGATVHLVWGAPLGLPTAEQVRHALAEAGVDVAEIVRAQVDARGSSPFLAKTANGMDLFVKMLSSENRDADWLFKAWRFLAFRELEDEAPFATPKQQIEHEAYLDLLAERAGVRVPSVVVTLAAPGGAGVLASERVASRSLSALRADEIDDGLLRKLWDQVQKLHRVRIAHRDLRRGNIIVDDQGEPWLIDFGYAEASASPRRLAQDVTELIASLAPVTGPERAVASAVEALGQEAVVAAAPLLQPLALSSVTSSGLRSQPDLLKRIREQVAKQTGTELLAQETLTRVQLQTVAVVLGLAFAVHILLPQVGELRQTLAAFRHVRWEWLVGALLGVMAMYSSAALSLLGAAPQPLPWGRTVLVQLAGSAMNRFVPKGLGGLGLNQRYLEGEGIERPLATASIAVSMGASSLIHIPSLIVATALLGRTGVRPVHLPKNWPILAAFVAGTTVAGVVLVACSPAMRRRLEPVLRVGQGLRDLLRSPRRALTVGCGALGTLVADASTLALCLRAFGAHGTLLQVAAVYLGGTAVASASPTPDGLGALEAALVAGLTALGYPVGLAVAGVLTYRLFTFWLPILPGLAAFRYLHRRQVI
jgi:uncharacterized membrane protein YbhN (UPF0104 family)/membrane-associated phospholipid phosphatase/tRNA A-37 threonylcarbamoyl transferase component Bud32